MGKLRVGLLFGGRSVEHDVSIVSATSILNALDRSRYEVSLIGVDPEGRWHLSDSPAEITAGKLKQLSAVLRETGVFLPAMPGETRLRPSDVDSGAKKNMLGAAARLDVVFPIIHGRGGEDGSLQGLLELADVPYVGSGVLSSALQMDKEVAKRLLSAAGLPVTPWVGFSASALSRMGSRGAAERAEAELGLPAFAKPANSGSSVGISKAETLAELASAIANAQRYDRKVLVEAAVDAREIEVAVLGNDEPEASVCGEIRSHRKFYDYEAKYHDDSTELIIPADLEPAESEQLRAMAIAAFRALDGEGMARVDFLFDRNTQRAYVNELNSLPGFTSVSMYPKLWEASGLPYPQLLDRLIELALERHDRRSKLETHAPPPLSGGSAVGSPKQVESAKQA